MREMRDDTMTRCHDARSVSPSVRSFVRSRQVAYLNRPIQDEDVHLSAPFIYADALEELSPKPGMSFLNIVSCFRVLFYV